MPKNPPKATNPEYQRQHLDNKVVAAYQVWVERWSVARHNVDYAIFIMSLFGIYLLMTTMDISVHVYEVYSQPPFVLWLVNLIIFTLTALAYLIISHVNSYYIGEYIIPSIDDFSYKDAEEKRFNRMNNLYFMYPYYAIFILGVVLLLINKVIFTGFFAVYQ